MKRLTHEVQKKTVGLIVDRIMSEKNPEDRRKSLKHLSFVMEHLFGDLFEKESFEEARRLNPEASD